ncbi:Acetyltransferase [Acidipropionibacterium acidipropionici ATCC 4875]|uniref:Acetyltransferase n=1 Tax=Acidipropionibacterium acidipropionici (strain ATCC 4875 / DSM 20272 / JCM 6432 / NBRC 12425 / NCIMB 8070 / 4) TaxID=1171373 RepID=K7S0J3_ACIA4|nr:GNAT family N-acetyltransferase [Acidipropionibacterium acidipropionici]AFV88097.1 Acetyltransferase [Acidipropionibacterium acidipropionici ATCC 4875]
MSTIVRPVIDAYSYPPEVIASLRPIPVDLWFRDLGASRLGRLVLRHALPEEYGEVGDVLEAAFTTGCWSTPEYIVGLHAIDARARTSNVWVVADDEGVLAAVLTPQPRYLDGPFTFNILGVGPRGRGLGLGRLLTDHAVNLARALGIDSIEIHSGPQMTAAHKVYVDYGFVRRIEQETVLVDGHQRLRSFTFRVPDPVADPPHIEHADPPAGDSPFPPPGDPVSITALRPAGAQDAGHFRPETPGRPEASELPDRRLRLVAPASSPRSWGAVLGARIAAPDWVTVEWFQEVSSPVLLDGEGLLVSDDWSWIARSLATASGSKIYPAARREEIDALEQMIDAELIGALEEVVFSTDQAVRDAVSRLLFARLGLLDLQLADRRYLLGDELTSADLPLFGVLLGWDLRYRAHLGWGAASLVDYPNLWRWARRLAAEVLSAEDRVAAGLEAGPDGSFAEPWGPALPVEGIDDIRAAWREPVE